MITKLFRQSIIPLMNNCIYHKAIFVLLILPLSLISQVSFDKIPLNKQLVARDTITNIGIVIFEGFVDNTSTPYESIEVNVFRNGIAYGTSYTQSLNYSGNLAPFAFNVTIDAELAQYSFDIFGIIGGSATQIVLPSGTGNDIVAGDVYIIEGQSNAEAMMYEDSANANQSDFIRVYASGTLNTQTLLSQDAWYYGNGDVPAGATGNTGQWGLKFASSIIDKYQIPVAIFNGATGNQAISYFERPVDYQISLDSNYGKLFYRLQETGLEESVRAIIWSQGENDARPDINTSTQEYIDAFNSLKTSWISDYPNVKMVYIFQTKSGCGAGADNNILKIKEAQRLLAEVDTSIQIIQTTGLSYAAGEECHFKFIGGYEIFGIRIFNLVDRYFYGGIYDSDIETPMVVDAYLQDLTKLVLETDAISLANNTISTSVFALENSGGVSISSVDVLNNLIIFQLSGNPGSSTTISYLGLNNGQNSNNLITNTQNIEIVCFDKIPFDVSLNTIWDGSSWSHGEPVSTMNADIEGNYNASNGNIIANNLFVNSSLNFDNGTTNTIVVYGDLDITGGSMTLGDQESLVMYDDLALITGNIIKNESSTVRSNIHDFTYWSSPVEIATISSIFTNVSPSRIFYFDQSLSSADASDKSDPTYWNVWVNAPPNMNMDKGKGFAAEGEIGTTGIHNISFTGQPNNGSIAVNVVYQNDGVNNDFNLLGNPYPSAIDIETFFAQNPNIEPVVYLWTHNTAINSQTNDFVSSDYATYDLTGGAGTGVGSNPNNSTKIPDKNIGSSQGFFIKSSSVGSGTVIFNNSMRIENANDQFFKSSNSKNETSKKEKDRIWINLTSEQGGFNQILIGFMDNATDLVDRGYDAERFDGGNPLNFYSQIEDKKYVIQGLSSFSNDKTVTLGFDINVAPRQLSIKIDKIEGILKNNEIFLIDQLLNKTHNLKESAYQFDQSITGENRNRFILKFGKAQVPDVDNVETNDDFKILHVNNGFTILAKTIISKLEVYDILGRLLYKTEPNNKNVKLKIDKFKKGSILIFRLTMENGSILSKKNISY